MNYRCMSISENLREKRQIIVHFRRLHRGRDRSDLYSDAESELIHADLIGTEPMQIGFRSKVRPLVSI